ncbi:MAG: hypothetical protein WAM79_08275 [Candidatus Sulfotelmatobacter sp.]
MATRPRIDGGQTWTAGSRIAGPMKISALPVSYDAPRFSSVNDHPVPDAKSDHQMKFYYDDESHREIPSSRWIR